MAVAAIPGFIDWLTLTDPKVVPVANWHARVNIITLLIFVASFYLRTTSGASWIAGMTILPIMLSIIGVIGLAIAGWLGGELVFRYGVAVNAETETAPEKPEAHRHIRAA